MKLMKVLALALFSFLFQSNVFGASIVYNGFECLNAVDTSGPYTKRYTSTEQI